MKLHSLAHAYLLLSNPAPKRPQTSIGPWSVLGDHCFGDLKSHCGRVRMGAEGVKRNSNLFFQRDALGRGKTKEQ